MSDESVQKVITESRRSSEVPAAQTPGSVSHPLIEATRQFFVRATPDHEGLLTADPTKTLDIRVSPTCLQRTLSIFENLIRAWESRGGSIVAGASAPGGGFVTAIGISPDAFGIRVIETVDEAKPLTDPTRLTGKLSIFITGDERREFRRRWSDTKSQRLERMLSTLVETLVNVLAVKKAERLDAECVARQNQRVEARRKAIATADSREFYWRQELLENVSRWHDAERIRAYLAALKLAVEKEEWRRANPKGFENWFKWASLFADSIDPIIKATMGGEQTAGPENTVAADLDLTCATRAAVNKLGVTDSDALWKLTEEAIRPACEGRFGRVWNEITRVLAGLGYDVAKRKEAYNSA